MLVNPNGTFNTSQTVALTGNNIFFHGEMSMLANGGSPVRLAGGGDLSHLHSSLTNGVMLPSIAAATARRTYLNVELAMLIDMGWNQYIWKEQHRQLGGQRFLVSEPTLGEPGRADIPLSRRH